MTTKKEFMVLLSTDLGASSLREAMEAIDIPCDFVITRKLDALRNFLATNQTIDLVIICDMACERHFILEGLRMIREKYSDVRLVVVTEDEGLNDIKYLDPWKVMRKPFFPGGVIEVIKSKSEESADFRRNYHLANTKNDIGQADQMSLHHSMSQLMNELDVLEAVIYSPNRLMIKTENTGITSLKDGINILDELIEKGETCEVIKIIEINYKKYLFHAKILTADTALGLLYNLDISYSTVRKQSGYYIEVLRHPDIEGRMAYQRTLSHHDRHLFRRADSFGGVSAAKDILSSNVCNADVLTVDSSKPAKRIKLIDTVDIIGRDKYFLAHWN